MSPDAESGHVLIADPLQTTLDQGIPVTDVTFMVVDLETTGGSPVDSAITEIGAVIYKAGERLGSFQTLVDPRQQIPPYIAHLTGIDDAMVSGAPPIEEVMPTFLEFSRGAVFVAHNARFDFSFLNATLVRLDYEPLPGPIVCTAKLARRVVWPDVPNVRLGTLARYFRTRAHPNHRALADAEACAEVLHGLLDVGAHLGILTLGDLHEACLARGRPNFAKIRLADDLPPAAGVYVFRGADGRPLYVGKSKNVRGRVKSYFYGDGRKQIQEMLSEVGSVDCTTTPLGELEALVVEARLISSEEPPYNRHGKGWRRYAYLKLDPKEPWPRLKVTYGCSSSDGCVYLGPFPSSGKARLAKEALEEVYPIRRCTRTMGTRTRFAPCALADMGRCLAPCDARTDVQPYRELVGDLLTSFSSPGGPLVALETRMSSLAAQERFEEAALVRDRARALAEALWRARVDSWLTCGRLVLEGPSGERLELVGGALSRAGEPRPEPLTPPCPRERADELGAVRSWICRNPLRVLESDVPPSEPVEGGRELARMLRRAREAGLPPPARSYGRDRRNGHDGLLPEARV